MCVYINVYIYLYIYGHDDIQKDPKAKQLYKCFIELDIRIKALIMRQKY